MTSPATHNDLPVVILVPGAWHAPSALSGVSSLLEAAGYETIGVNLPSNNSYSQPLQNYDPDMGVIRSAIEGCAAKGKDVVLFVHSYGGMPGNDACKGLIKGKDGRKYGVIHLVFCAAFCLPEGLCLFEAAGGHDLPWWVVSEDRLTTTPATPEKIFYGDTQSAEELQHCIKRLRPHSYRCFYHKLGYAAYKDVPCTYIFAEKDAAIPIEAQRGMVKGTGVEFTEVNLDTDHSPFMTKPKEVSNAVRRAAGEKL